MSARITKSFKVEADTWANFVRAAQSYGATPAEVLRELVRHVDAAMNGIESGRIQKDRDVSQLLRTEFPQLSPFQLRRMGQVLMQAAQLDVGSRKKGRQRLVSKTTANPVVSESGNSIQGAGRRRLK